MGDPEFATLGVPIVTFGPDPDAARSSGPNVPQDSGEGPEIRPASGGDVEHVCYRTKSRAQCQFVVN